MNELNLSTDVLIQFALKPDVHTETFDTHCPQLVKLDFQFASMRR